ncbi:response regulator transcription factor [Deinococcus roseus]|uniref:Sensory transduction protein regX3 n=1 Tax=Deinococcus roseus TaxID=392414 RepID=A0ABQ2D4M4_9DEIO|nr:response regulator transcription factor [Deinococcus roseus]GGJ46089.1 sensory transduction protein regX3 [Deinococcus roseus]
MARILLVEDEKDLSERIAERLKLQGHQVLQVFDGLQALQKFEGFAPDLLILDVMLPGLDGLSVCRRIRAFSFVPILMLTARTGELERVLGFEVGADDYVPKPFSLLELEARVRALLRRGKPMQEEPLDLGMLEYAGCTLDLASRQVRVQQQPIELTRREFDLLLYLVRHPGRVFSREWLIRQVWDEDYQGMDRTIDTHITRLRQKLAGSLLAEKIVSVRGLGYRLEAQS